MVSKEIAKLAAETLLEKKAIDVNMIDISEKSSFADYFVNATATNSRQLESLADEVNDKFQENKMFPKSVDGKGGSGWILMDYGDIIVNIFTSSTRDMYSLEKLWGDCEITRCED
ncbi:MAG: ribosome silencing factor [Clostridiales bacterium]|jgi:ribosome-associated protein|nr:ribosome silencing factor [Clostridiales bacterium]